MNCAAIRSLFSPYLDGDISGREMQKISLHLSACAACRMEFARLSRTQKLLAGLGRRQAPSGLALQLKVALSRAQAENYSRRFQASFVRWQNAFNSFMFPATAGFLSAVIFFGIIIGFFAVPINVQAANSNDVPLTFYTPPQLNASPFLATVGASDGSLLVDTYVDANGRVQDYRIISAPAGAEKLLPQLDNMMIFTTFRPATNFGRPTSSRVVLSFSGMNVKG